MKRIAISMLLVYGISGGERVTIFHLHKTYKEGLYA